MNHIPLPLQLYMPLLLATVGVGLAILVLARAGSGLIHAAARTGQARRLRRLRMSDMLDIRNIDQKLYLRLTPLPELRRQLSNCAHCSSKRQCDAELVHGEVFGTGFSYCPNTPALNALLNTLRAQPADLRVGPRCQRGPQPLA
jgi:hypothetical protein